MGATTNTNLAGRLRGQQSGGVAAIARLATVAAVGMAFITPCLARSNRTASTLIGPGWRAVIHLQRVVHMFALRIVRPLASHKVYAVRNGMVGVLSLKTMKMTMTCGTTWTRIASDIHKGVPAPEPTFADLPSFSPLGSRFVALATYAMVVPGHAGVQLMSRWQIWSLKKDKALVTQRGHMLHPAVIPNRGPRRLLYCDGGRKMLGLAGGNIYFLSEQRLWPLASPATFHAYHVYHIVSEREGPYLAAYCTNPGRVEIWDSRSEKRVAIIVPPPGASWGIFSPPRYAIAKGRLAIAWGRHLALYKVPEGQCLAVTSLGGRCQAVAFTRLGTSLAVCTASGSAGAAAKRIANHKRPGLIRLEVFRGQGRLAAAGQSIPFQPGSPSYRQLTWLGKHLIVFCSGQRVMLWRISWHRRRARE
jgi:hypothetical protein